MRSGWGALGHARRGAPAIVATLGLAIFAAIASAPMAAPAAAQDDYDDLDDLLGGFEEEDDGFVVDEDAMEALRSDADRWWDLSGSVEVSGTVNHLPHNSDTGTNYVGLQRLRNRGNLQLDLELGEIPFGTDRARRELEGWKFRVDGWAFYDAAYLINGRDKYTQQVLNEYEFDAEVGEFWLAGALSKHVDLKIGRQVVIWGRSESLRVLDVLNPLDNREPGRVDLEDLRRPLGMVKLDAYVGDWTLTAMAIPEIRFDLQPVFGSDFFTVVPGGVLEERLPSDWQDIEAAVALTGTFEGWDISFHGAWFWNDRPRLRQTFPPFELVHDRLWLVGTGGNYTSGSFLWKTEIAVVGGLGFFGAPSKNRLDVLAGVEYYGFTNTTITVEVVNRHILAHQAAVRSVPNFTRENAQEISARITRDFFNERMDATALAIVFGIDGRDGAIARFDVNYDIRDALSAGIGILFYFEGDLPPIDRWGQNDRIFFNLKYSF